jgi:hypothetical protein
MMTPSQLIELTEAKELMQSGQYTQALEKLTWLGNRLPQDPEIDSLIRECRYHEGERVSRPAAITRKPPERPQEVTIVFRSASNLALVLFIVITLSIVAAWYIIFFVLNFTLKIRPAEIQFFFSWLGLL